MRPEILNPLFAALTDLKGVGPQLAKPLARLGLERVVDVLFHLPTGLVQRHPVDRLDDAQPGQQIIITLTGIPGLGLCWYRATHYDKISTNN